MQDAEHLVGEGRIPAAAWNLGGADVWMLGGPPLLKCSFCGKDHRSPEILTGWRKVGEMGRVVDVAEGGPMNGLNEKTCLEGTPEISLFSYQDSLPDVRSPLTSH